MLTGCQVAFIKKKLKAKFEILKPINRKLKRRDWAPTIDKPITIIVIGGHGH